MCEKDLSISLLLKQKLIKLKGNWKRCLTDDEKNLLIKFTSFLPTDAMLDERRYYFINDLNEVQRCPVCGKKAKYTKGTKKMQINIFCSVECQMSVCGQKLVQQKLKQTSIQKFCNDCNLGEINTKEKLKEKLKLLSKNWSRCCSSDELKLLADFTTFLPANTSFPERRYYFINDLNEMQCCPVCGKKVKFRGGKLRKFCSAVCRYSKIGKNIVHNTTKKIWIKKYGVENIVELESFQRKIKKSWNQKTDVEKEKIRKKFKQKWELKTVNEKEKIKIMKRVGRRKTHFEEFNKKLKTKLIEPLFSIDEYINAKIGTILKFKCITCGETFNHVLYGNKISYEDVHCPSTAHSSASKGEQELADWISTLPGIGVVKRNQRYWNGKFGKEADIFLPEHNLVVEYNGLYFHSNKFINDDYHTCKQNFFENRGIDCIQIFENEWINEKDIVKNIIKQSLNVSKFNIDGMSCSITKISNQECFNFFTSNQFPMNYHDADINLGLFYSGSMVQCMSFKKIAESGYWEIVNDCTKIDFKINHGHKIFIEHFRSMESGSLIVQINRRYSNGHNYIKNNFSLKCRQKPAYFIFHNNHDIFNNNQKFFTRPQGCLYVCDCGYNTFIRE